MSESLRKKPFVLRFKRRMSKLLQPGNSRRSQEMKEYRQKRIDFLVANPYCAWGLKQVPKQFIRSTDIHHTRGRAGRLLLNEKFWLAVSRKAHEWIHLNQNEARALGLLCRRGEWGDAGKKCGVCGAPILDTATSCNACHSTDADES